MERTEIDMTAMAGGMFERLSSLNEGVRAEVRLETLPPIVGDRALLEQVWANLISNALKYSSKRERPIVEIGSIADDENFIYYVRDNGTGFDPRYKAKLFGVFQRLHDATEYPGTGVGLALVQRIVVRHQGRVWADGKPDQGASFYSRFQGSLNMQEVVEYRTAACRRQSYRRGARDAWAARGETRQQYSVAP